MDDLRNNVFNKEAKKVFECVPEILKKSITVDNGTEFTYHKELSNDTKMKIYFCDPYSPWQRGTNENTNGLLRYFFPKGSSFATVSDNDLRSAVNLINNRPRKRFGFKSPYEMILSELFFCCT